MSRQVVVYQGDALNVLPDLADEMIDAIVTDPPYELGFMGRAWDGSGIAYNVDLWKQCLRVLKPGGYLLAFGGTRTWHRLTCAIEDAGFEIRDTISWLYGSGFPKSLDVSKAIDATVLHGKSNSAGLRRVNDTQAVGVRPSSANRQDDMMRAAGIAEGYKTEATLNRGGQRPETAPATDDAKRWAGWGTALKPAHEPIVVARKLLVGTVAANVLAHGTGALNIDGCRVEHASADDLAISLAKNPGRTDLVTSDTYGTGRPQQSVNDAGRWPTNVLLDEDAAAELDEQSGTLRSGAWNGVVNKERANTAKGAERERIRPDRQLDSGGASRFFPVFRYRAKAPTKERPKIDGVAHPTVKPLELMRWLVRLVTPPDGIVLDPFVGSGTTAEACVVEGFRCLAIENEASYLPLIDERMRRAGLVAEL